MCLQIFLWRDKWIFKHNLMKWVILAYRVANPLSQGSGDCIIVLEDGQNRNPSDATSWRSSVSGQPGQGSIGNSEEHCLHVDPYGGLGNKLFAGENASFTVWCLNMLTSFFLLYFFFLVVSLLVWRAYALTHSPRVGK